MAQDAIC